MATSPNELDSFEVRHKGTGDADTLEASIRQIVAQNFPSDKYKYFTDIPKDAHEQITAMLVEQIYKEVDEIFKGYSSYLNVTIFNAYDFIDKRSIRWPHSPHEDMQVVYVEWLSGRHDVEAREDGVIGVLVQLVLKRDYIAPDPCLSMACCGYVSRCPCDARACGC